MSFRIAIDGPVAAGKGTISRLVAERLGFLYVDTGAMYRAVVLLAEKKGIDIHDEDALVLAIKHASIELRNPVEAEKDGRLSTVLLDGNDISWKIRTEQVSKQVSVVAAHPKVREELVKKQQLIASTKDVVMEGRDIAVRVLPNAQMKIFLTANEVVRAKRRHLELQIRGQDISFAEVYADLQKRDAYDSSRETDPLKLTPEHQLIDTSDLAIEQVVDLLVVQAELLMAKSQMKH